MKRLDGTLNGGSTAYADGNATTGAGGTVPQAEPLNHIQEELCYLVEQAGITLDSPSGNKTQVRAAVLAMIASYYAANSPDTYLGTAALTGVNFNVTDAALSTLPETFSVKFGSANPASATMSLNGGTLQALLDSDGVVWAAGDALAGQTRLIVNTGTELRVVPATQGDFLKRDGSLAMMGLLRLFGDAVHALDAVPLQQVTSLIAANPNNRPIATSPAAQAGLDDSSDITPLRLRQALNAANGPPIYACRAWVNWNGSNTPSIRGSGNVSSITDNGVGDYTINFITPMPDTGYALTGHVTSDDLTAPHQWGVLTSRSSNEFLAGSVRVTTATSFNATTYDPTLAAVAIFR